jgi:hypothetical protein
MTFGNAVGQRPGAQKFYEFGWVPCEQLRAILDNYLAELQSRPRTTGYIYVYEGKFTDRVYRRKSSIEVVRSPVLGEASYRTGVYRQHFNFRKIPADRYLFVDGGYRENFSVELWIVPDGAKPPVATPTLSKMAFRKGNVVPIVCEE